MFEVNKKSCFCSGFKRSNTIITVLESYQVVLIENTGGESHFSERLECVGSNDEKTKSPLVPLMTMTNGFVGCQSVLSIETPEAVHGAIFCCDDNPM